MLRATNPNTLFLTFPQVEALLVVLDLLERHKIPSKLVDPIQSQLQDSFSQDSAEDVDKIYQLMLSPQHWSSLQDTLGALFVQKKATTEELDFIKEFYYLVFLMLNNCSNYLN